MNFPSTNLNVENQLLQAGYSFVQAGQAESGKVIRKASGSWVHIHCLYHNEKTPSMGINLSTGGFSCFGCGASGSWKDLRDKLGLDGGGTPRIGNISQDILGRMENMRYLATSATKNEDIAQKLSNVSNFERAMENWSYDWRGITGTFLESCGARRWQSMEYNDAGEWGQCDRIYLPFKHPQYRTLTMGYAARRLNDETQEARLFPKYRNSSLIGTKSILYMLSAIRGTGWPMAIVEGPFDAIKLWYYGIPAVASLGTNQWSKSKTGMIMSKLPCSLYIIGDGDEAGWKFNQQLQMEFQGYMDQNVVPANLPAGLDPGTFDQAWIDYIYAEMNRSSNGKLDQLHQQGILTGRYTPSDMNASQYLIGQI